MTIKTQISGFASLLLALACSPAIGGENPGANAVIGAGGFSCGLFSRYDRQPNNQGQMDIVVQWAWGFMSAYNNRNLFSPIYQPHVSETDHSAR